MGDKADGMASYLRRMEGVEQKDREAAQAYTDFLNKILVFLQREIKGKYAELIDAQKAGASSPELKAIASGLTEELFKFLRREEIPDYTLSEYTLNIIGKPIPTPSELIKSLQADIQSTWERKLDDTHSNNPFQLDAWLEKISTLKMKTSKIAKPIK
jgi:hypothetical protein